eukprot:1014328-Amphidinium_carterae.1
MQTLPSSTHQGGSSNALTSSIHDVSPKHFHPSTIFPQSKTRTCKKTTTHHHHPNLSRPFPKHCDHAKKPCLWLWHLKVLNQPLTDSINAGDAMRNATQTLWMFDSSFGSLNDNNNNDHLNMSWASWADSWQAHPHCQWTCECATWTYPLPPQEMNVMKGHCPIKTAVPQHEHFTIPHRHFRHGWVHAYAAKTFLLALLFVVLETTTLRVDARPAQNTICQNVTNLLIFPLFVACTFNFTRV